VPFTCKPSRVAPSLHIKLRKEFILRLVGVVGYHVCLTRNSLLIFPLSQKVSRSIRG